jgi:hypothetical protein
MIPAAAWVRFRRMQNSLAASGLLAYAAGSLEAWRVLPSGLLAGLLRTVLLPGAFCIASLAAALFVKTLRSLISRHLMASYRTGFGQTVISVIVGLGVIIAAGGFLLWRVDLAAHGGRDPAGAFAGFGAGIGLLIAQALLARRLERDPALKAEISVPD